ncbi:MAG: metallophosphoesterase family protein [Candidatus Omnitrophota bacterium]
MKIAVLSDTHIPIIADDMPKKIYTALKGVDLIVHAGDIVTPEIIDRLSKIAPVRAVCGNMDDENVCARLPKKDIIKAGALSLGLIHGSGAPANLMATVRKEFKQVDVIIFGHSHIPCNERIDGVLFFNPGSPTDKIFAPYNSYGMIEITGKNINARIIKI